MSAIETSALIALIYAALAFIDGFVLHIWKYRLFAYPETRYEHLLHTLRALLFPVLIYSLFAVKLKGILLAVALLLAGADLFAQLLDMIEENRARQRFGGLSPLEYSLHVILTGLHGGLLTAYFLSLTHGSLSLSYIPLEAAGSFSRNIAELIIPGAILAFLTHVMLFLPYFRRFSTQVSPGKTEVSF